MKHFRRHLTYANVMSSIAVFLMLGGATAFAATKIGAGQLKANSVKTGKIVKEAVTAGKLKNGAVSTTKLANDAVTGEKANESTFGQVPSAAKAVNADNANALQGHSAGFFATTASEATRLIGATGQPPFENGWVNFGVEWSSAGFYKDSLGIVHLEGTITGGTGSTPAFTLPAGYRPAKNLFVTMANEPFGYIRTTGQVEPNLTDDAGLDGITFRAAG